MKIQYPLAIIYTPRHTHSAASLSHSFCIYKHTVSCLLRISNIPSHNTPSLKCHTQHNTQKASFHGLGTTGVPPTPSRQLQLPTSTNKRTSAPHKIVTSANTSMLHFATPHHPITTPTYFHPLQQATLAYSYLNYTPREARPSATRPKRATTSSQ